MPKTNKGVIVEQLVQKLQRMSIPVLYRELSVLDNDRKEAVINKLLPTQFRLLVAREKVLKKITTELWEPGASLEKVLLDTLSPKQLSYIGGKQSAGTISWGSWKYLDGKKNQTTGTRCASLSDYFFICGQKRIAEILSFFIKSTEGVSALAEERNRDIFLYIEDKHFPFEIIRMLSSVHPIVLFPAMNMLPILMIKKLLWICSKMQNDEETILNVFADSYSSRHGQRVYIDEDVTTTVVTNISLLENERLELLLRQFSDEIQIVITEALGKDRLLAMRNDGCLLRNISITTSFRLYNDTVPNDVILNDLLSGKKNTKVLKPSKVLQLIGELA